MGKNVDVKFLKRKCGYFTTIGGESVRLFTCEEDDSPTGPHYLAALAAYLRIASGNAEGRGGGQLVRDCYHRWVAYKQSQNSATAKMARSLLKDFPESFGHVHASLLLPYQLLEWIGQHDTWNATTKAQVWWLMRMCFRWNVAMGYTQVDPTASMMGRLPWQTKRRGEEVYLPAPILNTILDSAAKVEKPGWKEWHEYLFALRWTGARPDELAGAEPEDYKPKDHVIVLTQHKNAKRVTRGNPNRVIFLTPAVEEIVVRNAAKGGWLFPARWGRRFHNTLTHQRWHKTLELPAVAERFRSDWGHAKLPPLYSLRHSFITRMILNGTSLKLLAEWCGTSQSMIEKHYAHVTADLKTLRKAFLEAIRREAKGSP